MKIGRAHKANKFSSANIRGTKRAAEIGPLATMTEIVMCKRSIIKYSQAHAHPQVCSIYVQ